MASKKRTVRLLVGVTTLLSAGAAYSQATSGGYPLDHFIPEHPEQNPVATKQLLTEPPVQLLLMISEMLSTRHGALLGGGPGPLATGESRGMAAGGVGPGWNAWASASYNDLGYSSNKFFGTAEFDGDRQAFAVGADYRVSPALTVGLSAGYDDGSVKPDLGSGVKLTNRGYNLVPYVAYQINKSYSVDASLGWGRGEIKRRGDVNGFVPRYEADTDRLFGSINLNSGHWFNNVQISGKASLIYSEQENDADLANGLVSDSNHLGQVRVGAQAGYWVGNGLMPYAGVTYVHDFTEDLTRLTPAGFSLDRNGFLLALGLNYFTPGAMSAGVSFTSEVDRDDVKNDIVMANLNWRF